ncbi:MAG: hypothetical protein LBT25_11210 [Candidatus Symbiothrix sp.]|jgi:quinol-cytochrome oxidoreductase complex cytochrome b subunit|nr:hypothetical protein [Candidatus Symbiothrix sp.]
MELDELKNLWTSLDERLSKQEKMKESIIKEMIYSKSNKSVSRLLNYDVFSVTLSVLAIPVLVWLCYTSPWNKLLSTKLFLGTMFVLIAITLILEWIHIKYLMKIDFAKPVSHNSLYINKYNELIKKEKIASIFIIAICSFFGIYLYASLHANIIWWSFLICMLIVSIGLTYFTCKKIYKNIASIQQSLEELKELEEE